VPVDRNSLPKDPEMLQQMLVDLTAQLDNTQRLLAQLLAAKSCTSHLIAEQLDPTFVNAIIMRLNDPGLVLVIKPNETPLLNCPPEQRINPRRREFHSACLPHFRSQMAFTGCLPLDCTGAWACQVPRV
jgi:hypothetical protein